MAATLRRRRHRHRAPPAPAKSALAVVVTGAATLTTLGQRAQLKATAQLSDGATQDVTSTAAWESSNVAVVTVSAEGVVTSLGFGAYHGTVWTNNVVRNNTVSRSATFARIAWEDKSALAATDLNRGRTSVLRDGVQRMSTHVSHTTILVALIVLLCHFSTAITGGNGPSARASVPDVAAGTPATARP